MNNVHFSDTDTAETVSTRSSRTKSVVLSPFSNYEFELAESITDLMENITAYPKIPQAKDSEKTDVDTQGKKPKASQELIKKASRVASAVKKLSGACGDVFASLKAKSLNYEEADIKNVKSKLYSTTIKLVDDLKDSLIAATLQKSETKKHLIETLISIANQSNTFIEKAADGLSMLKKAEHEMKQAKEDIESTENAAAVEPDGEGYSIIIPAGVQDGRPREVSCAVCVKQIQFREKLVQYMGDNYCQQCFVCFNCTMPVTHSSFLTLNDNPICRSCSPKCSACRRPITSDCFIAMESFYHVRCFQCATCKKKILPEERFYKKANGACCTECMSAARDTVFQEKWNPKMKTRYSLFLEEELVDTELQKADSQKDTPRRSSNSNDRELPVPPQATKNITLVGLQSLPVVLSTELGIDYLIKYCVNDYCIEKLFFWMDVEQFRLVAEKNPQKTLQYAKSIFEKYIKKGSEMEILFRSKSVSAMESSLATGKASSTIFDSFQKIIYEELECSILPKFLASWYGSEYIKKSLKPNAEKVMTKVEKGEPIAIPTESSKDPEHVLTMEVTNFEKRYKPEKHYVYEILIKRVKDLYPRDPSEKKKVCPVVYRKFEDFLELHLALQKYFPELKDKLPQFSMKTAGFFKIGPSKTGKQRFKELNDYIQQLFKMPSHVVQSVVLKKFIQPTQEDLDNYEFSKRISTDISGQKRLH